MSQTLSVLDGRNTWLWYHVEKDLKTQGNLADVHIDPLSVHYRGCGGTLGAIQFYFTWIHGALLILSMSKYSQELVDAFTALLEYPPYCRYTSEYSLETVEWAKQGVEKAFNELQKSSSCRNLVRLPQD